MYVCVPNTVNVTGLHKYKVCFGDLQIFIKNFVKLLILGRIGANWGDWWRISGQTQRGGGERGRENERNRGGLGGRRGSGSSGYCLRGAGLCRQGLDVSVARVAISSSTDRLPLTVSCRR